MTDHSQLSDRELTRVIAERQGWRDLEKTTWWREDEYNAYVAELWRGTPPPEQDGWYVPSYAESASAALDLLREMNEQDAWGMHYDLAYDRSNGVWFIEADEYGGAQTADPRPERSCCYAWLLWKDAQEAAR